MARPTTALVQPATGTGSVNSSLSPWVGRFIASGQRPGSESRQQKSKHFVLRSKTPKRSQRARQPHPPVRAHFVNRKSNQPLPVFLSDRVQGQRPQATFSP